MPVGLDALWSISLRITALAVLVQSLEWLRVRAAFADTGVFRYEILAPEQRALPWLLRVLCAWCLPYRGFVLLLGLRLGAAALLLFGYDFVLPLLFVTQLLVCIRFRGTSNGGSDAMTVVLLLALSVSAVAPGSELARRAALLYIAVQVTLSYLIAGLAKLRQADWWQGRALCHFALGSMYGAPPWLRGWLVRPLSWLAIAFECLFPLAWLDVRVCAVCLALGCTFHLANAWLFGLNRFVLAWLAGYPAVFYACQLVSA